MTCPDRYHAQLRTGLPLEDVRAVLFDLDGTLLNVDMQRFIPAYLEGLAAHLTDLAHSRQVARVMRDAVIDMLSRVDGRITLEQRMLTFLEQQLSLPAGRYQAALDAFCDDQLEALAPFVVGHPLAESLVGVCEAQGWQIVLATNPIFPRRVIDARIGWAGLDPERFAFVTDYETSRHCKPHQEYFLEVLERLKLSADVCLMVGNDTQHDMAAGQVGMATCLLTPWQIDHRESRFPADWSGSHEELLTILRRAPGQTAAESCPEPPSYLSAD